MKKVAPIEEQNRFKLSADFVQEFAGRQPAWGSIGYVVYKRTYARPVDGTDRTEEFWETCQRVVEGIYSYLQQRIRESRQRWDEAEAQRKAQDMYRRMFAFKWLPPGRGLWAMGSEAIERNGALVAVNCAFISTDRLDYDFATPFATIAEYLMLGCGVGFDVRGAGKFVVCEPERSSDVFHVEDSREGWVAAFRATLDAYAGKRSLPASYDFSAVRKAGTPLKTFGGTASGPAPLQRLIADAQALLGQRAGQAITTTDIVDLANFIGRTVVSGNIRRSAEIALAESDDAEFRALKDPTRLTEIEAEQRAVAARYPRWVELDLVVKSMRELLRGRSPLSSEYASGQDVIDAAESEMASICAADHDWLALHAETMAHPMTTHRWASNNSVFCAVGQDYGDLAQSTVRNGEPGYVWLSNMQTRGRMADAPDHRDARVRGMNPCSEIPLEDHEVCNLCDVFPTHHESLDDFLATLKVAYLYCKVVTTIPTQNEVTNAVVSRNRRIGVSVAGVAEMYSARGENRGAAACREWFDAGYRFLRELDDEYSGWLGVPRSVRLTTVKPGGTVPLLVGVEGGIKFPTGPFYMRTVRIADDSPLLAALRDAGHRVEPDRYSPGTAVVYFPVRDDSGARAAKDVTLWEQMELLALVQRWWADNAVSVTINFRPEEAKDIERALSLYDWQLKAVSFNPLRDHAYVQPPYCECTEAEYHRAASKLRPLEIHGVVNDAMETLCQGDACAMPTRAA